MIKKIPYEKWLKSFVSISCLLYILFLIHNNYTKLNSLDLASLISNPRWILILMLMPINWFIESVKWKQLVSPLQKISKPKATMAILSGLAIAMFTPNRVGEFGGRIMFLERKNRWSGILATWIGSITQLCWTIDMGILGLYYLNKHSNDFASYIKENHLILILTIAIFATLIALLLSWKFFIDFIQKKKKSWYRFVLFIRTYSTNQILSVFLFSGLRYLIFTSQFIMTMQVFEIDLPLFLMLSGIAATYLISSLIPSITLLEFGIRGSVAIFIFSFFNIEPIMVLGASTALWLINVATPAALGSIIINKIKL